VALDHKSLSLIIPAYNEEAYIGSCLDSVLQNACGRFHEIIVVDNASSDRTCEIARARRGVRVVREMQKGVCFARQRGLEEATGEILAFIDADTRLPADWTLIAERTFQNRPNLVCLSGPYRYYDGPKATRRVLNWFSRFAVPMGHWLFGYMLVGGNFIATKRAIKEAGGFDTTINFFGDDLDLGRRLHRVGQMAYRSDFFVWSSGRRFYAEGLFKASLLYLVNSLCVVFFRKPFSTSHRDVRASFPDDAETNE
jgi:glycosyltransferase involved in cell wall biosynthesis